MLASAAWARDLAMSSAVGLKSRSISLRSGPMLPFTAT